MSSGFPVKLGKFSLKWKEGVHLRFMFFSCTSFLGGQDIVLFFFHSFSICFFALVMVHMMFNVRHVHKFFFVVLGMNKTTYGGLVVRPGPVELRRLIWLKQMKDPKSHEP